MGHTDDAAGSVADPTTTEPAPAEPVTEAPDAPVAGDVADVDGLDKLGPTTADNHGDVLGI